MGGKLGKSKSIPILENTNGQEQQVTMNSNNHTNGSNTLERKNKKKKERISNRKSLDIKVDKYTSTDGGTNASSPYIKKLVADYGSKNLSYDSLNFPVNSTNRPDTPSKDVLELRDACIRRGIICPETNSVTLPISSEEDYPIIIIQESENEPETTIVTDNEQVESSATNERD